MTKTHLKIEVVSVEEAKRILKREKLLAQRNGKRKLAVVKKSRKSAEVPKVKSRKPEVLTS